MTRDDAETQAARHGDVLRSWRPCYGDHSLAFSVGRRCGDVMQAHGEVLVPYDWPLLREPCPGPATPS